MPVCYNNKITKTVFLSIWKITESPDYFLENVLLSESEQKDFKNFKNESRKSQWLSCRLLVNNFMDENDLKGSIHYDTKGKPHLTTGHFISISHTPFFSTVIISVDKAVGIDIEKVSDRILKIRNRIVSTSEESLIASDDISNLTALWSAKEAIYKLCGINDISFKNEISISGFTDKNNLLKAKVNTPLKKASFLLKRILIEDHILVYVIDN